MPRLVAAAILLLAGAPTAWAQDVAPPVQQETVARFKVRVTAAQQVAADVYEFMRRVERRNQARTRLGVPSPSPELELVLLVTAHARIPPYQRDIGIVYLRLDREAGTASVEYCLAKCESTNPDLAIYRTTTDTFEKRLEDATRKLAKYRAR